MATGRNLCDGDLIVRGRLQAGSITLPNDSVGNGNIRTDDPIEAVKLEHQHVLTWHYGNSLTTPIDITEVIHVAFSAGEVYAIRAGVVDANVGDSTIVIDLKKNGTSVLSSTITLSSAEADYEQVEGTTDGIDSIYTTADVFEVSVDAIVGTGTLGKGLFIQIIFREGSE